jgi:hypothetical protein
MSIQLVLANYLAGLKERNELDALLPELLRAMGHSVQSRPQLGVFQAGVDVLSTHVDESGRKVVFAFIVKFGDLGRSDFMNGQQAIVPSVHEACNTLSPMFEFRSAAIDLMAASTLVPFLVMLASPISPRYLSALLDSSLSAVWVAGGLGLLVVLRELLTPPK